ncbi:MAG: hypothetical protein AAF657_26260 [Acidobacteriota bacterium]
MIEFVSLLLGLVTGVVPVEVSVLGQPATVELWLDGEMIESRSTAPWRFECDLGTRLAPHELVAIARDARGNEIDLARQWVNIQQQSSEAAIVFSGDEPGRPDSVGLIWQSLGRRHPQSVEMSFDGSPLAFTNPERVTLPEYDASAMHFLSATVRFDDNEVFQLEASFGGGRGGQIMTELTAIGITLEDGAKAPPLSALQAWFLKQGQPVRVHGVEKGSAEVIVVRDPAVQPVLEELVQTIRSWSMKPLGQRNAYGPLGKDTQLRVLSPAGAPLSPTHVIPEMFVRSEPRDAASEGLLWLSQQTRPQSFAMFFGNAVALAGMEAHSRTSRRAVVLLLGDGTASGWSFSPERVRDYLRILQVPLFVWSLTPTERPEWAGSQVIPLALDSPQKHRHLKQAIRELRKSLEAQRIVWLEGRHLPQNIELSAQATGIRLAGS